MTAATESHEEKKMTRKQAAMARAKEAHAEWCEDNGSGGDAVSDMSYRAHLMSLCRIAGLDENMVIAATQVRVQAGLPALDVPKLLFSGRLASAVTESAEEIAEATIENRAAAEKAALKKKQGRR